MKDVLRSWKNVDQFSKVFDVHLQSVRYGQLFKSRIENFYLLYEEYG